MLSVGLVCQQWHAVARDEFLWKELFYRYYRISREVPRHPGALALARGEGAGVAAAGPAAVLHWSSRQGGRAGPGGICSLGDGTRNLPAMSPEGKILSPPLLSSPLSSGVKGDRATKPSHVSRLQAWMVVCS